MSRERSEREVILSIADDEEDWTVFTDSRRFGSRLRKVAAKYSVAPEPRGEGYEFRLPLDAIRLSGPRRVTEKQKAVRKELMQRARLLRKAHKPSHLARALDPEG